jgi:phasin family protein
MNKENQNPFDMFKNFTDMANNSMNNMNLNNASEMMSKNAANCQSMFQSLGSCVSSYARKQAEMMSASSSESMSMMKECMTSGNMEAMMQKQPVMMESMFNNAQEMWEVFSKFNSDVIQVMKKCCTENCSTSGNKKKAAA